MCETNLKKKLLMCVSSFVLSVKPWEKMQVFLLRKCKDVCKHLIDLYHDLPQFNVQCPEGP